MGRAMEKAGRKKTKTEMAFGTQGAPWKKKAKGKLSMSKHYPKGLDGRERDRDGQIREKRGDTRVGTLRKEYGDNFARGYRSDTKLETVRDATGKSLSDLVKKK
jgi:hypothetical protein